MTSVNTESLKHFSQVFPLFDVKNDIHGRVLCIENTHVETEFILDSTNVRCGQDLCLDCVPFAHFLNRQSNSVYGQIERDATHRTRRI